MAVDILDTYWQELKKIPTLTAEDEELLAERIQEGDEFALDELVTANLRYIVPIARQLARKTVGEHVESRMDDLISEGNMALLIAARKWDPSRGIRFAQYAAHDIRKAMQKMLPQQNVIKKEIQDQKLRAGRPMTDDHVEYTELSHSLIEAMHGLNEREQIVVRYFYGIATDDRMTMAEIGQRMGLKRERIRQIRKTAERKMRRIIRKNTELDLKLEG